MKSTVCNMDCFNCKHEDCIYDEDHISNAKTASISEEKASEYHKKYQAELRKKRRSLGLCIYCGQPAEVGQSRCGACRIKSNRKYRENYRRNHPIPRDFFRESGCYFCGEKCVEGKKVCKKHLEICRKNAASARSSDNHKKALVKQKSVWEAQGVYRTK